MLSTAAYMFDIALTGESFHACCCIQQWTPSDEFSLHKCFISPGMLTARVTRGDVEGVRKCQT